MRLLFCFFIVILYTKGQLPTLEIQPKVIWATVGESLKLFCKSSTLEDRKTTQLEWRDPKNKTIGSSLESEVYVQRLPSMNQTAILVFTEVEVHHEGEYVCSAKFGNIETIQEVIKVNPVKLHFFDAPYWQFAKSGADYLINCRVFSYPLGEIAWIRNNETITSKGRYIVTRAGLLLKNIKPSDSGNYTCRVSVIATGIVKERNITVEVTVPPLLENMKEEISIIEGQQAKIQCKATGNPSPHYKWIKEPNSKELATVGRFEVGEESGVLIINKAEHNDSAVYRCIASNVAGTAETRVTINVVKKN